MRVMKDKRFRQFQKNETAKYLANYAKDLKWLPIRVIHEQNSTDYHATSIYNSKSKSVSHPNILRHKLVGIDIADHSIPCVTSSIDKHEKNGEEEILAEIHADISYSFN